MLRQVSRELSPLGAVRDLLFLVYSGVLLEHVAFQYFSLSRKSSKALILLSILSILGRPSFLAKELSAVFFISSISESSVKFLQSKKKILVLSIDTGAGSLLRKFSLRSVNSLLPVKDSGVSRVSQCLGSAYYTGWSLAAMPKIFFLRFSNIYNKGRYSRNRQTYRTGVYLCLWLTVLSVIGLYYYFYVFLIKFSYL